MRSAPLAAAAWLAAMATAATASGEHRRSASRRLGAAPIGSPNRRLGEVPSLSKFAATIVAVLEGADSRKLPPGDLRASVLKELNLDDDSAGEEEIAQAYAAALEKLERKGAVRYNSAGTKIKLDELDDDKDKGESGGSKRDDDDDSKDGGNDDDDDKEDSPDYQLEPEDGTGPAAGPDSDQDGVADAAEDAAGTDPTDPDSDRDGATDGQEAGAGTDGMDPADTPAVSDQDRESVSDVLEEIMGTDPADPDTDKDGARYVSYSGFRRGWFFLSAPAIVLTKALCVFFFPLLYYIYFIHVSQRL